MKKSFMTRVLATGLSLAMAFSLSAATNVSVASAAAKPAMKSKTMTVKVGQKKNYQATAATQKAYKITKVKMSAAGKTKAKVTVNSSKKSIKVEGLAATKGSNVVISFKNNKTKKTTKVTTKVVVKDEKLTMTAAATGVKKIAVTFNKAVDTATTKIVVKKASATPTITTTFAADAKSAELAMGTKLTEGTYTVEATVGENVLTADITVQDEKLTTFALVNENLVASADSTTTASISFKALNQYEEMMPADNLQATCSFGKVEDGNVTNPTADKTGSVKVTDINPTLAIVGQTGTLVIVDKTTGKSLNATVTYQSKAVASAATVYGVYSDKTEKLVDGTLKAAEKVTNYWLMMNIQDQYESDMTVKAIKESACEVSLNPASVLTNVSLAVDKLTTTSSVDGTNIAETTKDGKTCILIKITAAGSASGTIDKAGKLNLTIVSANKGVLATPTVTVEDKVLISSLTVSPADTLYAGQDNKLAVDAIDTNGNAVTKYDELKNAIDISKDTRLKLKKNSDGTGTFYFNPGTMWGTKANKWKDSKIDTIVMYANDPTSGKYIVKTTNVTYYANKQAWAVSGVGEKTITAVVSGQSATFDLSTLKYEDQYGNQMEYKDITTPSAITAYLADNADGKLTFTGTSAVTTNGAVAGFTGNKKATFTGTNKTVASLYLMYQNPKMDDESKTVSDKVYDIKVPLSVTTSSTVSSSDLTLTINDGKPLFAVSEITLTNAMENSVAASSSSAVTASAVVTAKINGKNVVVPAGQFTIIEEKIGKLGLVTDTHPEKTETKTITAVVQTEDGPQTVTTDVVISNAKPKAGEIKKADTVDISGITTSVSHAQLFASIKVMDQYGNTMSVADDTVMKITATGANEADIVIPDNATQKAAITFKDGGSMSGNHTITVKYTYAGLTLDVDITLKN